MGDKNAISLYNLIIDLRNVQLELKCESNLDNFSKKEKESARSDISSNLINLVFDRKLLFMSYMLLNSKSSINIPAINSIFSNKNNRNRQSIEYISQISNSLLPSNLQESTRNCIAYAKQNPNSLDQLTFSVIPGFFQYFWCKEMNIKFREFINLALKEDREIAIKFSRVIFFSSELFYDVFDLLIDDADQIPKFIEDSFIQKNDLPDVELCTDIFHIRSKSEHSHTKSNITATISQDQIPKESKVEEDLYFFTKSDLVIITWLLKLEKGTYSNEDEKFIIYHCQKGFNNLNQTMKPSSNNKIAEQPSLFNSQVYDKKNPIKEDVRKSLTMILYENFNTSYLRKLLIEFPTIQVFASNNVDDIRISTLLAQQLYVAPDEQRLVFERKIERLRKIEEEEHQENGFLSSSIAKLREGIANRTSYLESVAEEVSKLHRVLTVIQNRTNSTRNQFQILLQKIELNIIENWAKNNASNSLENLHKLVKGQKEKVKNSFTDNWQEFVQNFQNFAKSQYNFGFDLRVVHDCYMSHLPFSEFSSSEDIIKKEKDFIQILKRHSDEIKEECTINHKNVGIATNKNFIQNRYFLENLTNLFNGALDEQTPVKQIFAFVNLFKFIDSILSQLLDDPSDTEDYPFCTNEKEMYKLFTLFILHIGKEAKGFIMSFEYMSSFLWFGEEANKTVFGEQFSIVSSTYNILNQSKLLIEKKANL